MAKYHTRNMYLNTPKRQYLEAGNHFNNTLLKIIKGTHVVSGIADLASMLHFMQDMCMLGNCLSNIKSHGWMIFRVKTMPLGVGEHPHPYIRIGW